MYAVGLTGGIASGKSTFAAFLAEYAPVIDTDAVTHKLYQPRREGYIAVVEAFGQKFLRANGALNTDALRTLIFSDKKARIRLEKLIHPLIKREVLHWREKNNNACYGIIQIPLLFEAGWQSCVDYTVTLDCLEETQMKRAQARGMDEHIIRAVIASQYSSEQRRALADIAISTECSRDALKKKAQILHTSLRMHARQFKQ